MTSAEQRLALELAAALAENARLRVALAVAVHARSYPPPPANVPKPRDPIEEVIHRGFRSRRR